MKHQSRTIVALLVSTALVTGGLACASGPQEDEVDPFAVADEEPDLLDREDDDEGDDDRRRRRPDDSGEPYDIDQAPTTPQRAVDGSPDGWDMDADRRDFDTARHVYDGENRWDGPDDLSFSAAVDADDGHVYFWVEVTDDQVVDSDPADPLDAVVIRLRDPQLDDLLEALPPSLEERLDVELEAEFAITPDGRVAPVDRRRSVPADVIHTATELTDDGYLVEAAFSLEALPYLAEMPLADIAFQIDVFDADDPSARGPDTRMTAIPHPDDGSPRFAAMETEGMLPTTVPRGGPTRPDAFGLWRVDGDRWGFESIEYVSSHWKGVDDLRKVAENARETDVLPDICTGDDIDRRIVEAYDHHRGAHRVALVLCGTPAPDDRCPSDAETQLVWTSMHPDGDMWAVDRAHTVFDEPLNQCPTSAPSGEVKYHDFSMLPFDRIDTWVWGIGYHKTEEGRRHKDNEMRVRIVSPDSDQFVLTRRHLQRIYASGSERTLYDSRIYLTDLEDGGGLDICEVEDIREQHCDSFMSGCETRSRGHEVIARVDLWNDADTTFDDYLLTRHDQCRGSTTFDDISGYKLLIIDNRLGLLPARGN